MLTRSKFFFTEDAFARLRSSKVIVFGLGGVGSWAAECLVRTGITDITLVDFDTVARSNINRQLQATSVTVGESKAEALRRRLMDINPDADIKAVNGRYSEATAGEFDLCAYDYVVDAIDSVADKALLILNATSCRDTMLVSSMGEIGRASCRERV